jgi:flavodoxin
MKTAIRYFSKFGHTEKMAKIVGELTNTHPELATIRLSEPVDTLYIGSGVLLGKVDNSIAEFINSLTPDMVKSVVCFGSSAIIKSPVPQMREMLQARGITVSDKEFSCKGSMGPIHMGHPNQKDLDDFRKFILTTIQ